MSKTQTPWNIALSGAVLATSIFAVSKVLAAKDAGTPKITPPKYPSQCDTIDLPAGFEFPTLTSELPYDLDSLKNNAGAISKTPSECEVFELQKMFDLFSWSTFIGLNWPADTNGEPLKGQIGSSPKAPRVWETYLMPSQIFRDHGATPEPWGSSEEAPRSLGSISKHTHILNEVDEAFFNLETPMPPITDLNKAYVRYEIRINKEEYLYIKNKGLYSVEGQDQFIKAGAPISFPKGKAGASPVRGAMELKAAWKKMGLGDDPSKFHTIKANVVQPFAPPGTKPIVDQLYGLVGLHIMVRTESAPQWVWATFEHVGNAPVVDLRAGVPSSITGSGKYSFWDDKGQRSYGGFDPTVYQNLKKIQDDANYYQPLADRGATQITRVITDNNSVSESKWTKNLNKVMQAKLTGTVWENYRLISTQWPTDPKSKTDGNPAPVSLGNPVMETYMQVNGSCMGCHNGSTFGGDKQKAANANFSFMLQRAKSTKPSTKSTNHE